MDAGQQLFQARQRRGLTLDDISRTTKIPVSLLQAIERHDTARLPQGFFTRAFVRAYAAEVGLNPEQILEHFDQTEIEEVPGPMAMAHMPVQESTSSTKSLVAVIALCAATVFYSQVGFGTTPAAPAAPVVSAPQPAQAALVSAAPCVQAAPVEVVAVTQSARRTESDPIEKITAVPHLAPIAATHVLTDTPIDATTAAAEASPVVSDAVAAQPETVAPAAPVEQF